MGFLFRKLALLTFLIGALGLGAGTAYVQMLAADLPELTSLKDYNPPVVSNVYDRNGGYWAVISRNVERSLLNTSLNIWSTRF